MAKSFDKKFSEIVNQETGRETPSKFSLVMLRNLLIAIAFRGFLTGVSLLGIQWMFAQAMPTITAIHQIMPLWVAFLGGLALNSLVSITALTVRAENSSK